MICQICQTENSPNDPVCRDCGAELVSTKKDKLSSALPVGVKMSNGTLAIGRVLGKGGFGVTYLGSDLHLKRSVAIKELFPGGCSRDGSMLVPGGNWPEAKLITAKEKFLREARILAQFQHPNIVHVYTSFEENNTAYMVMEYLRGRTMFQLLREFKTIPEPEAVDYIVQLADALKVIHKANFLHRDIKPANLLVADDGRVTLIDFGATREFAAGVMNQMTTMLTPGYAPLEQYTRNGKMGPSADIYAAGATLYHLLTGQQPIAATDQANGAILTPPRQFNPKVSATVSDAVMWSMQLEAEQRPQTVEDFIAALQGQIVAGPTTRRRVARRLAAPTEAGNPNQQRIEQILDELAAGTAAPPPTQHDIEINAIQAKLNAIITTPVSAFPMCPACVRNNMTEVTGEIPSKGCPICHAADLDIKPVNLSKCPVCRNGELKELTANAASLTCPFCSKARMRQDRRKRFGFAADDWLVCDDCSAELNSSGGGRWRLAKLGGDPNGIGKSRVEESLTIAQWRQLAGRPESFLHCGACTAQFDIIPDKGLLLSVYGEDPYGTGASLRGRVLAKNTWANIAAGLPPDTGNANCPGCHSQFDVCQAPPEIRVVKANTEQHPWSQRIVGRAIPLKAWYASNEGKRTSNPGWLCSKCHTEFDTTEKGLKLATTPKGPLSGREGEVHSKDGWHRISVKLPTRSEETAMRDKLARLHILKQKQLEHYYREETVYQTKIKGELDELIHKAFLEGFVPVQLKDTRVFLVEGETLFWEGPAKRNHRPATGGRGQWTFESRGVFLVTNQRIIYDNGQGAWQQVWDDIDRLELEDNYSGGMVCVFVRGYGVPVGFELSLSEFTITTEYSSHTIRGSARDLVALATAFRRRERGAALAA